jgi:CDP-diacylglycerol--glycerol-3-phosphate 3-phosphatidyltransferase
MAFREAEWKRELRKIPNQITCARLLLTALLYWPAALRDRPVFLVGFVVTFFSDVLDGYLARRWKMESYFGMRLDSYADYFLMASSLYWAWRFNERMFVEHAGLWVAAGAMLLVPQAIAMARLGRNAGFHLYTTKLAGWIAAALFVSAVAGEYSVSLLYALMWAVAVKSAEETAICLLVSDPYEDPQPSLVGYLRRGRRGIRESD